MRIARSCSSTHSEPRTGSGSGRHCSVRYRQSLYRARPIQGEGGVPRMEQVVYVDGKFYPASDAKVSVFDHGLLYGDGVFEGIRAYNKRVFKLERHVERMYQSAKASDLKIPLSPEQFSDLILHTGARNIIVDGCMLRIVTGGAGSLGLAPRKCRKG